MKNKRKKVQFLILDIMMLLLTFGLIPLNMFVINFPEWIVSIFGIIAIIGFVCYTWVFHTKPVTKIVLPVISVILVTGSVLLAYAIPYWNSFSLKSYKKAASGYDEEITFEQASRDMKEMKQHILRVHPMFRDGLTKEIEDKYEQSYARLKEASKITVNDLRREIQSVLNPMHDAHTTSYKDFPDDRFLKKIPELMKENYGFVSVNGKTMDDIKEQAKAYYSYETEEWITVDVGSLATLDFYNFAAPYIFVWENDAGEQITEQYTSDDFVSFEDYLENAKKYSEDEEDNTSFVYYDIDEEKSLAKLTLTSCRNNDEYRTCIRQMFSEIKEKNIANVAVDLRDNGGGNSGVANEFIKYLPIDEYNDSAFDFRLNFFSFHEAAHVKNKKNTDFLFKGKVYILTNSQSFSSAMLFPLMIQDNGLGKVIGQSPANNANGYGDIVSFRLGQTGLPLQVSAKKWYRSADKGDYVVPDYACDSSKVYETLYAVISKE